MLFSASLLSLQRSPPCYILTNPWRICSFDVSKGFNISDLGIYIGIGHWGSFAVVEFKYDKWGMQVKFSEPGKTKYEISLSKSGFQSYFANGYTGLSFLVSIVFLIFSLDYFDFYSS